MKIHKHEYKELLLLLSNASSERLSSSATESEHDLVELSVSNILAEDILDELTDVLSAKGIDANGHINNFGIRVEAFIDLF